MKPKTTRKFTLFILCLISASCRRQSADRETPPFRIVATDSGFEAPDGLAAGLRHVIFENRGSEIHEAMLVKLAKDMSADDYVAAVRKVSPSRRAPWITLARDSPRLARLPRCG